MSEEKIIRCGICEKIVALENGWKKQKIHHINGLSISKIVYSAGGWGRAETMMYGFSEEVCDECFNIIKEKINELNQVIKARQGCQKEGVCIYGTPTDQTTGNKVSDLQSDELQHKRHPLSLLRLLPRFSR